MSVSTDKVPYEFNAAQEQVIAPLAKHMSFVGQLQIVMSALTLAGAAATLLKGDPSGGIGLFQAVMFMLMGIWTVGSAKAFSKVVQTQGNDMEHLMAALTKQAKLYKMQYILFFVALVIIAIGLVAVIGMTLTTGVPTAAPPQ